MTAFDVVVVGLGAVGSATTHQLARRGVRVLGIDQFSPPHALGSSSGDTRITRTAVGEGAEYVPLAVRSHELWRELEAETGRELFVQCGGLIMGVPDSTGQHGIDNFATATREVARSNGIPHEVMSAEQIQGRFGVFATTTEVGCFEPTAGYLLASSCIEAELEMAARFGASLHTSEQMRSWTSDGRTVTVTTEQDTYESGQLVVAVGPWLPELLPELAPTFRVQRQVQYWLDAGRDVDRFRQIPIFIWLHGAEPGEYFYGFPARQADGTSVKVATETYGPVTTPAEAKRTVDAQEVRDFYDHHVRAHLPGLTSSCTRSSVCLYTVTRDFGFVVDTHPEFGNVVVASPCSGHGFKHSAALGECIADLATGSSPRVDISPFSLQRFA